jgi:STE24 endopeptidase
VLRPGKGLIEPDPVDVQDYFSTDDIVRARRFGHPQLALQAASTLVRAAVLLRFIDKPLAPGRGNRPLLEAAVAGAGLSAAVGLAPLPLRVLMRRRALAVGLARQSWGGWVLDLLKSSTIEIGLSGGSAAAAVWLMRRHPRGWWLAFSGASVAGAALFTFLAPVLLDPIFNRFEVLADGDLRREVFELAERAQVNVGEVYQVDASSRTSAANAYVSGFAHTKRVVLFDTLIQSFTAEETRLVVAHELAHVRHRDLPRGLAHLALSAPGGMYGASCLLRALGRHPEQTQASAQTLPALALALSVVGVTVGSPSAALSRRVEQRADAFSLKLTDEPEPFIAFERRIVSQNLADPDPPRWLVRLMASHPPAVERIGIALAYARAR